MYINQNLEVKNKRQKLERNIRSICGNFLSFSFLIDIIEPVFLQQAEYSWQLNFVIIVADCTMSTRERVNFWGLVMVS